ncbi:MAG: PAS domain-containing sensor histidine kinase, partial [Chloroflexota bacterium]
AVISVRLMLAAQEQQFRREQRLNLELGVRIQEVNETHTALKQERNLLRTLIDAIPANVYIKDTQSRFVDANLETALQMGVKTANDLIGKTDFDFFSPALAGKYFANEQAILQSGQPLRNLEEVSFDHRTQQENWLLTTEVPILDTQDKVIGLVGISLDITERKHSQEQITQERMLLRTLIDHLPDYIFVKDAEGRFVNSNAAHNRAAHVEQAEALRGKLPFDVFPAELAVQYQADDQQVLQLGQALVNVERTSIDAQGQERTMLTTKVPLHDAAGKVTGLVGISRDITIRKQAEQQALELRNERQRVQVLHQFISDATHDLMTPIAGINLSTDLARRAPTPERLIAHLDKIAMLSEKLQDRLQDMLSMSQLDMMTAADLEFRTVDLAQFLERLVETFRLSAEAKGQQFSGELDADAVTVYADDLYLGMALGKIVENAIHYTGNSGSIQIAITRREEQVAMTIRDTGIGIAEANLGHIFERFYRVKSHRPLDSGAGLGLSIVQRIVELHNGQIEVTSVVGSGSTFTLLLPDK